MKGLTPTSEKEKPMKQSIEQNVHKPECHSDDLIIKKEKHSITTSNMSCDHVLYGICVGFPSFCNTEAAVLLARSVPLYIICSTKKKKRNQCGIGYRTTVVRCKKDKIKLVISVQFLKENNFSNNCG